MAKAITDESFGAWVIKCHPDVWDVMTFLELGHDHIDSWSIRKSYRTDLMKPGQPVVFWVSGPRDGDVVFRGVWGIGTLTTHAEDFPGMSAREAKASLWRDAFRATEPGWGVGTDITLMDDPIPAAVVQDESVLRNCEIFRAPQMSNPAFLTRAEFKALRKLHDGWLRGTVARDREDDGPAVLTGRGAGFGTPEQNKKVEDAAMGEVARELRAQGFEVEDVSARKLGWDLTAIPRTTDEDLRLIEVKGVSGNQPRILLTRREHATAAGDERWELAVVTNALGTPQTRWFTGRQALTAAEPFVFQVTLR